MSKKRSSEEGRQHSGIVAGGGRGSPLGRHVAEGVVVQVWHGGCTVGMYIWNEPDGGEGMAGEGTAQVQGWEGAEGVAQACLASSNREK